MFSIISDSIKVFFLLEQLIYYFGLTVSLQAK